jgi:hypothetical protein
MSAGVRVRALVLVSRRVASILSCQEKKRARCDTGTSAGTGSHAGTFPAVYANVRKTREKTIRTLSSRQ